MQLSVKQSPCASVVRSHPGPHQSSWRSWIARLPPKEQVARSSRAEGAKGLVTEWLGPSPQKCGHAGSNPVEASATFPAVDVRTRACERGSTAAGYRLNRFESCMPVGAKPLAIRRPLPHPRSAGTTPDPGRVRVDARRLSPLRAGGHGFESRRVARERPRSSAAEHQHRCAPPHPRPPARPPPRRNHE
jgi:hypothetical protein